MTGFGAGSAPFGTGRIVVELRSVNQRFLDVRARLPREFADLTIFAEQIVRERMRRGRVELAVRIEGGALAPTLDVARARSAFAQLASLRDALAPGCEVPLTLLSCVPDLWSSAATHDPDALRAAIAEAISAALTATDAMCIAEGAALRVDLERRAGELRDAIKAIAAGAGPARAEARRRLRERLEAALEGLPTSPLAALDIPRLEAEVVLLTERGDVAEELTRLCSHLDQLAATLKRTDSEPVGRRIEFVLQEMAREVNTIGAKAQDSALATRVVDLKVEIERMREQAQNVE